MNTGLIGVDARRFGSNVAGGKAGGGISDGFARAKPDVKPLMMTAEPVALTALASGTGDLAAAARTVVDNLTWPGKPVPPAPKNTRTPEEDKLFAVGKVAYETNCTGCHQAHGEGQAHTAAALAGSQIVIGRPDMSLRVLLNGKDGKIGEMPPLGQSLSDNQLAGVLTYIRGSFGNTATPIHPALAKEFRQLYAFRKKPWTDAELQKQPR